MCLLFHQELKYSRYKNSGKRTLQMTRNDPDAILSLVNSAPFANTQQPQNSLRGNGADYKIMAK